jgi:hypothetical protein
MKAYQHYIDGIKIYQNTMIEIQREIEVLLAKLNYEESLKENKEDYEDMI